MRRAIQKHGPPEHLYVDNGKDYKKVARGAMPGYLSESPLAPQGWWRKELEEISNTGLLARLGIAVTHCIPHHPQSKHVERFFRTVHERYDRCWPAYTSGSPATRPDATEAQMVEHRKLLRAGRVGESRHPLASAFIAGCLAWMEEYNETPHDGEGMNGASPFEVFNANRNPEQRSAPDTAALALLLAERETRQVRECAVTLKKRRYVPVDQAGWATLHEWNEREIVVVFDPNDRECAAALDLDGALLAWLRLEDLIRFAPGDEKTQAQIGESFRIRRGLEKATRETLTAIARTARANGALSPVESMAARFRLPAGETGVDVITQRKPKLQSAEVTQSPATPAQASRILLEAIRNERSA
jgi:hypothetical protein